MDEKVYVKIEFGDMKDEEIEGEIAASIYSIYCTHSPQGPWRFY
jgi:hypothetical protein